MSFYPTTFELIPNGTVKYFGILHTITIIIKNINSLAKIVSPNGE